MLSQARVRGATSPNVKERPLSKKEPEPEEGGRPVPIAHAKVSSVAAQPEHGGTKAQPETPGCTLPGEERARPVIAPGSSSLNWGKRSRPTKSQRSEGLAAAPTAQHPSHLPSAT